MAEAKIKSPSTHLDAIDQIASFPSERAQMMCAAVVFAASITLYALTLAPTVTLVDSGELIVAARLLGVAHPPGFPLYTLLAHLFTLAPVGNTAQRVNFASAVFAALASAMLTLLFFEAARCASLTIRRKADKRERRKSKKQAEKTPGSLFEGVSSKIVLAAGLMAGLLMAFSRTLWAYATIAEVYSLNTFLILGIFYLMMRWRRQMIEASSNATPPSSDRSLLIAAFVLGLAMGVHHVTIGLMLPALAALVYSTAGLDFFTSRRLARAAAVSISGLVVYVYLPIAASGNPAMNWGDPRTLERLWWHVSGRQYQEFLSFSLKTMKGQMSEFLTFALREFGPWWMPVGLLLIIAGLIALFRFDRAKLRFLALIALFDLAYALNYDIAEDKDAYYLPVFAAMAAASAFGALWLARMVRSNRRLAMGLAFALLAVAPAIALAANLPFNDRSRYRIAEDYVENIFSTIDPGGMLLTLDWQVYSPLLYLREIENRRADVVAIDVNQLRRSWYFDYLRQAYPSFFEKNRDRIEAYLADLRLWEADPDRFNSNAALTEQINRHHLLMVTSFVSNHIETAPVYATEEFITSLAHRDGEVTRALTTAYQLVPQGLVFEIARDRQFHQPKDPPLVTRGLADGSMRFEADDVVRQKVFPVYVKMLTSRGLYLAAYDRHDEAIEAFKAALALDPAFERAKRGLAESSSKLRQSGTIESETQEKGS
jgi:hypothetical protein